MIDVLIVDDNPHMRKLLGVTLSREFRIMEAEDGVSAMDTLLRFHPKIVLLDIMMPSEIDGLQLLDAIKCNPATAGTVIGMVTARGQLLDETIAKQRGADAYFVKPFSPQAIHDWVREKIMGLGRT
jgi:DNA-binding response OmpR family regulator